MLLYMQHQKLRNKVGTYDHDDNGNPMCIEDGWVGEPYATRLVEAVKAYKEVHK